LYVNGVLQLLQLLVAKPTAQFVHVDVPKAVAYLPVGQVKHALAPVMAA
jgi:hypothetical protein